MRLLPKTPVDYIKPWYTRQRVGVNIIKQLLPKICGSTEKDTKYTNHSLRATTITRMVNGSIPERVIAENSGHKSIKSLRCYEKTSFKQEQVAGQLIIGTDVPKEEPTMTKKKQEPAKPNPVHEFSGTLNICTINIHYNQ